MIRRLIEIKARQQSAYSHHSLIARIKPRHLKWSEKRNLGLSRQEIETDTAVTQRQSTRCNANQDKDPKVPIVSKNALRPIDSVRVKTGTLQREESSSISKEVGEMGSPSFETVLAQVYSRGRWLVGLLIAQSLSGVVIEYFQSLIQDHIVVSVFLTMLVGAGGNAGNQSAIYIIRGLAKNEIESDLKGFKIVFMEQCLVAFFLVRFISDAA